LDVAKLSKSGEVRMSVLPELPWPSRTEHVPMSLDDFLGLRDRPKAEYVDGQAVVSPPASRGHNRVQRRLAVRLEADLVPGVDVAIDAGWRHADRLRVPDIAVFENHEDVVFDAHLPILVVEVLSPSTASEDTVRKAGEYQSAGIAQYWIVDRDRRTLTVYGNNGRGWDQVLVLDDDHPFGGVVVGEWGEVSIDLTEILG
jgi:Uma2 family endonuclease